MDGTKALALDAFAERRGLAMLRFDYSGTGVERRRLRRRHADRWLDESAGADRPADRRAADPGRLVDGRLARASRRACAGPTGSPRWSASPPRPTSPTGAIRRRAEGELLERGPHRAAEPVRRRAAGHALAPSGRSGEATAPARRADRDRCPVRLIHGEADRRRPDRHRLPDCMRPAAFSRCPASRSSRAAAIACRNRTRSKRSCARSPASWSVAA